MEIGVQTFTIRKAQKKNLREAYLPLVNKGIKSFEIARIDFNRENALKIKSLVDELGITVCSAQVKPKHVFNHPEDVIEFCKITGCKNVVISQLPFSCVLGREELFYEFISTLDGFYDRYEKEGITLAFHHHNWEYVSLSNGKRRMDELLSKTQRIKFVHDTYWTAKSGIDPTTQIERFGNRLLGIHLRDLTLRKKGIDVPSMDCAIGDGVIDFARVFSAAEKVGCSYYVIEQKTNDPYAEIEKSYIKCKEILGEKE